MMMDRVVLLPLVCALVNFASSSTPTHSIQKRGVPVGHVPYGTAEAANAALNEISSNERVAEQSASSAVGSAVGRDYKNRVATTAQYVAAFTVPVTKEGAGRAFQTIRNQQKAADVSSALASNERAIHRAASGAASSNYDQAFQAQQLGYQRPSSGYGGGGGRGGSGGGSGYGSY